MEIRQATAGDARAIAEVHVASSRKAYRGILDESLLERFSIERRTEQFEQAIGESTEEIIVAEDDGQIVGFATFGQSRDEGAADDMGELWCIYVAPEFWGRGAGTALVNRVETLLRERECRRMTLWVLEVSDNARGFYQKRGFSLDGTVKHCQPWSTLKELRYQKSLE
jgi:ribosomal protein S18 acetylase RimI-like enzyme